jgi:hypothetical protein
MTGVYFKGRLGNQMFQYVFLRYLREHSSNPIVFFTNPHHAYLAKYFEFSINERFALESKLFSIATRLAPIVLRFNDVYFQNFVSPKPINPKSFTVYHGYFQTDWYYNQLKEKPRFEIKPEYVKAFLDRYGEIFQNEKTVVVHIRRTDYLTYGKRDISLPIEYFQARLNAIDDLDSYKVFFVSDDIPFVKQAFPAKPNFIFSSNDEITDFQIIQNADIAIISNSSFAWWASYLNKKNGVIYAPKNWMGFGIGAEHPKKVMTEKFVWCEVLTSEE